MGICLIPRRTSFQFVSGFLQKLVQRGQFKICSIPLHSSSCSTAAALLSDDDHQLFDIIPLNNRTPVCPIACNDLPGKEQKNLLSYIVVTVYKTLSWNVARKLRFVGAVEKYGFGEAISGFRCMAHVFAFAGMDTEVYSLLRDVICYYTRFNLDLFELFPNLIDSPTNAARSAIVFDALMKVFAANSMTEHGIDVFLQVKQLGLMPSSRSCNFLLKCLIAANKAEFVVGLFEELKNFGPYPTVYTYTIMINFYCTGPSVDIEKAANILKEMEDNGQNPTVVTYSTFIRGLCKAGYVEPALDCIRGLRCRRHLLNSYCFNAVMHEFCCKDQVDEALRVLEEMKSCEVAPDLHSYSILIQGFCKTGNLKKAQALIEEMEVNNIAPSYVTYSPLLEGFCKSGQLDKAFDIFSKLGTYDSHAYNILINGCFMHGDLDLTSELLKMMINESLVPNASCYNNMIQRFCKSGSLDKALEFFNIMIRTSNSFPSIVTCNYVVQELCCRGSVVEALQLMDVMREQGMMANAVTYGLVVRRLCKEGKSERALELIPVMFKMNVFPSVVIYSTIINGFVKQLNSQKALLLYERMLKAGVRPDRVARTILINILIAEGEMHQAYMVLREMVANDLNPDRFSYTSVIAGFSRKGDMKKALELYKEMLQRGHLPSVVTYTCLIDGFSAMNRMDNAALLVDEMRRNDIFPDVVTYNVLIAGYRRCGQLERSRQLFDEMVKEGISPDHVTSKLWHGQRCDSQGVKEVEDMGTLY